MSRPPRLPPLNALRALHEVARHDSLREAAESLLVSPQAVGQQVRLLEEFLGISLLERDGRKVRLTHNGIVLCHHLATGFEEFAEGVRRVSAQTQRKRINLNASPYFATRYLMPRLADLRRVLPDADLALTTMIDLVDLAREDVDISIQWGYGARSDVESALLIKDTKVICCVPEMGVAISSPEDLLPMTLLRPVKSERFWPDIFRHLGLLVTEMNATISFDDAATMRRATLQGAGVGLLSELDAVEDVRKGRLVAPFGLTILRDMPDECMPGFYAVTMKAKLRDIRLKSLFTWLVDHSWNEVHEDLILDIDR